MKMKKNNKGFSLVELIIVIAIMAVLIGLLAPQYLKFVKESKVSTDITNAEAIASAVNVAVADNASFSGFTSGTAVSGGTAVTGLSGFTAVPASKVDSSYEWVITWDTTNGVSTITLGGAQIYPTATAYETANP